jgi:hypothetical protein
LPNDTSLSSDGAQGDGLMPNISDVNVLGLWIDETLIICDFSSDDLQNFISDDNTDEIL